MEMNIAVFGLGKLGSCIAAVLAQDNRVYGVDVSRSAVEQINNGNPPVGVCEPALDSLLDKAFQRKSLSATTNPMPAVCNADIAILIVPTPSKENNLFSSDYVLSALNAITFCLLQNDEPRSQPLPVVIISTLTPGSMKELAAWVKTTMDERAGEIELIYSPVFVALGNVVNNLCNPDAMLVGTETGQMTDAAEMYINLISVNILSVERPIRVMTWLEAELAKLTLNVFLSVKSLWANEIALLCRAVSANADAPLDFVGLDRRIGSKMLKPGFPPGGPCLPRDVKCLLAILQLQGIPHGMVSSLIRATENQIGFIAADIASLVGEGDQVGIIGFSYKPGTPVTEASRSIDLAKLLWQQYGLKSRLYDLEATLPPDLPPEISQGQDLEDILLCCPMIVIGAADLRYIPMLNTSELATTIIYDVWGLMKGTQLASGANYYSFAGGIDG